MAIAIGEIITYADLTTAALEGILSIIVNTSTNWYNTVCPSSFKPGYNSIKHTHTATYTPLNGSTVNITRVFHIYSNSNFNYYFTDVNVARNKIQSNLNAFLTARNIDTKNNMKVTTTGFLNFFNNLAAYAQRQICVVCGHESNDRFICFNTSGVDTLTIPDADISNSAPQPNINDTQTFLTDANITSAYQGIISVLVNNMKDKPVTYTSGWTNS